MMYDVVIDCKIYDDAMWTRPRQSILFGMTRNVIHAQIYSGNRGGKAKILRQRREKKSSVSGSAPDKKSQIGENLAEESEAARKTETVKTRFTRATSRNHHRRREEGGRHGRRQKKKERRRFLGRESAKIGKRPILRFVRRSDSVYYTPKKAKSVICRA